MIVFAELTGTEPNDPPKYFDKFKVEIHGWKTTGLDEQSWVKCYIGNIHRVHKRRMLKKIGSVNLDVMIEVLEKIMNQK